MAHAVEDDPISNPTGQPRRKALRRLALPTTLALTMLVVTQVVLAAPPENLSFSVSDSTPTRAQTSVAFDAATATDPEGDSIASYEWNFGDGTTATGQSVSHTYAAATALGIKTVTLTVTDVNGEAASTQQQVEVVNATPSAAFTISPNPAAVGQAVTFDSVGSGDPDGSISPANTDWDLDGDGSFERSGKSVGTTYSAVGPVDITLQVTDSNGATDVLTKTLNVTNTAPTAGITSITGANPVTPNVPDVNEQATFVGSGDDPDEQPIKRFEWDFDYTDGTFTVDATGETTSHAYSTPGQRTVAFRAIDSADVASDVATRSLKVNSLPVARIEVADMAPLLNQLGDPLLDQNPEIPLVNHEVLIHGATSTDADASNPSEPIAAYTWSLDLDNNPSTGIEGFETNAGTEQAAFFAGPAVPKFATPGPKRVRLEVTDSDGAKSVTTRTFRVNTPPDAAFFTDPPTPVINQPIKFRSASIDPDAGDSLDYKWDLDDDGNFGETGSATQPEERGAEVNHSFVTANTYRVRLRVTDTGGITQEAARNIVVQNTIPRGGFTWSPNSPLPGQAVTFSGAPSVATAGKQIQSYQWDFDFDPTKDQFDVNASGLSASHRFPSAGTKTIALKVTETGGDFAIVYDRITVNAEPKASFSVSPQSAFVNDTVTLSSSSSDPDGPLVKQEWDLDNDGKFDEANAAVVFTKFRKRGRYPVKLRVTDSKGATATASGEVTVRTRPLTVLSGVTIGIKGSLRGARTQIERLLVRAPRGSKISVRCRGRHCPKVTSKKANRGKRLRFKSVERIFNPSTKLIVTVTKKGYIGKQTTFTIRRGLDPLRRDLCLTPGAKKAKRCPAP